MGVQSMLLSEPWRQNKPLCGCIAAVWMRSGMVSENKCQGQGRHQNHAERTRVSPEQVLESGDVLVDEPFKSGRVNEAENRNINVMPALLRPCPTSSPTGCSLLTKSYLCLSLHLLAPVYLISFLSLCLSLLPLSFLLSWAVPPSRVEEKGASRAERSCSSCPSSLQALTAHAQM